MIRATVLPEPSKEKNMCPFAHFGKKKHRKEYFKKLKENGAEVGGDENRIVGWG